MGFKKENLDLYWTKDYDAFTMYDRNREIDNNHCEKRIQQSLLVNGWLKTNPMLVDKQKRIRDGQHRFLIAKRLGLPIPVLVVDEFDDEKMFLLNNASKKWTNKDYLHYHVQKGDKNAKIIYNLMQEYKLTTRTMARLCHFSEKIISDSNTVFKRVSEEEIVNKINMMNDIVDLVKVKTDRFYYALITIIDHPHYDHRNMLKKLSYQLDRFHTCNTVNAYVLLLQDIYNYKSHYKVVFIKNAWEV